MIKQSRKLLTVKKVVVVFGIFMISSFKPIFAQTNSNQATTLLEIQALREEVAELRDLVERQQYELRKIQSQVKDGGQAQPQSNRVVNSTPNLSTTNTSNVLSGVDSTASVPQSAQSQTNSSQIQFQSDTGRLQIPSQTPSNTAQNTSNQVASTVSNATSNLPSLNQAANQAATTINQSVSVNGIDASVAPVAPVTTTGTAQTSQTLQQRALNQAQTSLENGQTQVSSTVNNAVNQATRVNSATFNGATNNTVASSNTLPSATVGSTPSNSTFGTIKPVETISQAGTNAATSVNNAVTSQTQQALASQVPAVSSIPENDYYQQGFNFLKESKHDEAVNVFQQQIKAYPQGDLADDAYYWIAESLYVSQKIDLSKENFKAILNSYPKSERVPEAMLKLATIEKEQGNAIESRILLQEIIQFHPQSDAAISAKNKLSELK